MLTIRLIILSFFLSFFIIFFLSVLFLFLSFIIIIIIFIIVIIFEWYKSVAEVVVIFYNRTPPSSVSRAILPFHSKKPIIFQFNFSFISIVFFLPSSR